ncbi:ABC transporter permease [Pontibacter vulgaris]|uniref:ABC transporter permease n=1 Tax=Pontibacter vulgaris TaxID=2905679 RepID=UPI001FA6CF4D|nr:ABC transporter permease [Pontibacter vulgaris]
MKLLFADIQKLWHDKIAFRLAVCYLLLFAIVALLLPLLPLPFAPQQLDLKQVFQFPFNEGDSGYHLLGTDALGRDVLVGSMYGARTALFISFPVMVLSTLLGLFLGAAAGYFGNVKLKISRAGLLLSFVALCTVLYFGFYVPLHVLSLKLGNEALTISLLVLAGIFVILFGVLLPAFKRLKLFKKTVAFPLDWVVLRLIETFTSIPTLIFILVLASFAPPSILVLAVILILTTWTNTARIARAEMLRVKQLPYFEAAASIGATEYRLILRHALPNIISPVVVTFVFGLAGILALESTLSFLGIAASGSLISWGGIMAGIRSNTSAWWLVFFPGMFLSATVLALQICSYYLLWAMQQRKR